jgi:toxin ParE1/3/4
MASKVLWLDQAKDDIGELLDYLHAENPAAAVRYIDDLERSCAGLADFPRRGRPYNERYRAIVVRNHLVFYRYESEPDEVVIVAVLDGRRELPKLIETIEPG